MNSFSAKGRKGQPDDVCRPRPRIAVAKSKALLCALLIVSAATQGTLADESRQIVLTVTDATNGEPLANAVIELVGSGTAQASDTPAVIAQQNHEFDPHVLVVPRGQAVDFPNRDGTRHHVYSFSRTKSFNIELYADRPKAPLDFETPGIVELGCNIHDRMQAFIYVARYGETGLTDANGQTKLAVPAGSTVRLRVWHERLADNTKSLERSIDLGDAATSTLSLRVAPLPKQDGPFSDLQKRFDNL